MQPIQKTYPIYDLQVQVFPSGRGGGVIVAKVSGLEDVHASAIGDGHGNLLQPGDGAFLDAQRAVDAVHANLDGFLFGVQHHVFEGQGIFLFRVFLHFLLHDLHLLLDGVAVVAHAFQKLGQDRVLSLHNGKKCRRVHVKVGRILVDPDNGLTALYIFPGIRHGHDRWMFAGADQGQDAWSIAWQNEASNTKASFAHDSWVEGRKV